VTVYSVYEPSALPADVAERADRLAFVKEGFSWIAFLVPALWLIFYRMWIELIVFVLGFAAIQWAFGTSEQGQRLFGWVSFALVVLFAFEANDLRSAALERRGYRLVGVASGSGRSQAELSFFRSWLPEQARPARTTERAAQRREGQAAQPSPRSESEEVIGLFPAP
jgi:Protein of unknown function (DUF2628)